MAFKSWLKPWQSTNKKPVLLSLRSSTWFIIATVCTAVFTDIFLYAVIVPVFPFSLVQRIGVDEASVQHWLSILLSVYGVAVLVFAPIFGYISDRVDDRRGPFLAGMVVLGGATTMLCLARNLPLLIVGRILQGASAGVVWVVGLALLADTVGERNVGQAMGYVATGYSLAAFLGPLLGGVVYDKAGYYSVFAMAFGMIGLDIVLRWLLIEKKVAKRWLEQIDANVRDDLADEAGQKADNKNAAIGDETAELEVPQKSEDISDAEGPVTKKLPPMLILLKSRRMQASFWASTTAAGILTAFDVTLPLFVEQTFNWTSLGAGLICLALLVGSFIQPLYGWCVDKYGPRWIATAGFLICIPSFVCLRLVTHSSIDQKVLLCALLCMIGFGVALVLSSVMAEFTYIAAEKERKVPGSMGKGGAYAQSYSLFNVSWALGSLVGAYWAGGVKQRAGWGTMAWSFALLCAVVSIPTVLYCGGSIFEVLKRRKQPMLAEER